MLQTSKTGRAKKGMKILMQIIALGASSFLLVNSSYAASQKQEVNAQNTNASLPLSNETLRVAFSIAPPFVTVAGELSDLIGIDVDLVRELQKRTGFKTPNNKYDIMNFGEMMELGIKGEIDIIGGGIYATESRYQNFDFAGPSYKTYVSLVTHKDSPIKDISDLNGKMVAAENGTVATDLIPPEANVKVRMIYTPTNFMALYNVSRGIADAVITDEPLAQIYIDRWPDSALAIRMKMPDSDADMALVLKKNTEATRILQQTYQEMLKDGTVASIVHKYNSHVDVTNLKGDIKLDISGDEESKAPSENTDSKIDKSARYERIANNQGVNTSLEVDDVFKEDADPFGKPKEEVNPLDEPGITLDSKDLNNLSLDELEKAVANDKAAEPKNTLDDSHHEDLNQLLESVDNNKNNDPSATLDALQAEHASDENKDNHQSLDELLEDTQNKDNAKVTDSEHEEQLQSLNELLEEANATTNDDTKANSTTNDQEVNENLDSLNEILQESEQNNNDEEYKKKSIIDL